MPDRTTSGKAVDTLATNLKRRKLELDVETMKLEVKRNEYGILENQAEVERKQEVISSLIQRIRELEGELNGRSEG